MALELGFGNITQIMSAITPLLLIFFLLMSSVINHDIKGIVYLMGVLLAIFVAGILANMVASPRNPLAPLTCQLFNIPGYPQQYNNPALNSLIITFTATYLMIPLYQQNETNPLLIAVLLLLLAVDAITKVTLLCNTWSGIIFGSLLGVFLGSMYFSMLYNYGSKDLLYFMETVSDRKICSMPRKQKFKCNVYKNGELIQTL